MEGKIGTIAGPGRVNDWCWGPGPGRLINEYEQNEETIRPTDTPTFVFSCVSN